MKIKMKDGSIQEAGFEDALGKKAFRHTTAHILAQAVKRLYPDTKCAIGPSVADGFYYDFDFAFRFSEENFGVVRRRTSFFRVPGGAQRSTRCSPSAPSLQNLFRIPSVVLIFFQIFPVIRLAGKENVSAVHQSHVAFRRMISFHKNYLLSQIQLNRCSEIEGNIF